jgi:hypothetical protein
MWNNQRHAVKTIAQELNTIRDADQLILTENVGIKKICGEIMAENLTSNQLQPRRKACCDIWQRIEENNERLSRFITRDKRWDFSV